MTDQPETVLEYHFKILSRTVVVAAMLLSSVLYSIATGLTLASSPLVSACFAFGSASMLIIAHVGVKDGRLRALLNRLPGSDLEDIERPNEQPQEVPADD